jgi:pimeloyl-ACP methyl ester carboxylesterase
MRAQGQTVLGFQDVFRKSKDGSLNLYARNYDLNAHDPVLCLHGLTRNSRDFETVAKSLSRKHRVIVPDQRGRGRSDYDPNPDNYHINTYVEDTIGLLDHLGVEKVNIVGTSMGGLMAMMMVASAPERIGRVVLNDIGPVVEEAGLNRIRTYVGKGLVYKTWSEAALALKESQLQAYPDYKEDDWTLFARRTHHDTGEGIVASYDSAISEGLKVQSSQVVPPDLWPLWALMKGHACLLIRGGLSDLLSAETVTRMLKEHPGAKAITIANRGHAPTLEESDAFTAVDQFLSN